MATVIQHEFLINTPHNFNNLRKKKIFFYKIEKFGNNIKTAKFTEICVAWPMDIPQFTLKSTFRVLLLVWRKQRRIKKKRRTITNQNMLVIM